MSDDTPERAEPDPVRRRAGRTVPPIIDLKADAPQDASASGSSSARREESSTMFHRSQTTITGPLVLGALAGAIAGTVATFLIMVLPTKSKDDVTLRLSTLEANQSLFSTADRSSALEQQSRNFEKKFVLIEDSLTRQNQKITELAEAQKALSEALTSAQKSIDTQSGMQSTENLTEISKRIDALSAQFDQLKNEPPVVAPDEKLKLATALVVLLSAKDHVLKNQTITRHGEVLKTLNLSFIMVDDLKSLETQNPKSQEKQVQKTQNQLSQNYASPEWSDRLWSALSRLVTISSVEEQSNLAPTTSQDIRLKIIDQMIDLVLDRIIAEGATP